MSDKYGYIINPLTNRKVKVTSKLGKSIINSYKNELIGGGCSQPMTIADYDNALVIPSTTADYKKRFLDEYILEHEVYLNALYSSVSQRNNQRIKLRKKLLKLKKELTDDISDNLKNAAQLVAECSNQRTTTLGKKAHQVRAYLLKKLTKTIPSTNGTFPNLLNLKGTLGAQIKIDVSVASKHRNEERDCLDILDTRNEMEQEMNQKVLAFLERICLLINTDTAQQLQLDEEKILKNICIPITKIYKVPEEVIGIRELRRVRGGTVALSDRFNTIQGINQLASNVSNKDNGGKPARLQTPAEKEAAAEYMAYARHIIKPRSLPTEYDLLKYEDQKIEIAERFFGKKLENTISKQCTKKCYCNIGADKTNDNLINCFGKLWGEIIKEQIYKLYDAMVEENNKIKTGHIDKKFKKYKEEEAKLQELYNLKNSLIDSAAMRTNGNLIQKKEEDVIASVNAYHDVNETAQKNNSWQTAIILIINSM